MTPVQILLRMHTLNFENLSDPQKIQAKWGPTKVININTKTLLRMDLHVVRGEGLHLPLEETADERLGVPRPLRVPHIAGDLVV